MLVFETARRRILTGAALVALVATAAACDPVVGSASGPVRHATMTSASGTTFRYGGSRNLLGVTQNRPSTDANVREVFWYADSKFTANQETCSTWNTVATVGPDGPIQPGVALGIAPSSTGGRQGVKAITVTQNVYFGAIWIFNVHLWDSANGANPFLQIASFDLSPIVGKLTNTGGLFTSTLAPAPWHICARIKRDRLTFIVWTGSNPKPSWSDTNRAYTTILPTGSGHPGYAGGYIGHLRSGQVAAFSEITTTPLP